jgi:glycosyltransferase involved in cell wall biosynthesis
MKPRIAMVGACPYPVPQGSQVLLGNTSTALYRAGHEVHLVVYGYGVGTPPAGLHVHRCARIPFERKIAAGPSFAKPFQDLALIATIRRVVRENEIDVVHAHNYEGLLAALAARVRPIVYHAHNAMADELPHFFPGTRRLGSWMDKTWPRRADRIIAPHSVLAEYLAGCGCDPAQIHVIPPPLEVDLFTPRPVSNGIPAVLYTGNLDRYQNLQGLLRIMELVRAQIPAARLVVATAARLRLDDMPGAERFPTPDFQSLCEALADDVVLACPRVSWSGYPIKVLNGMAAGRPVVAFKSAGYPIASRFNGITVPDNDDAAFAESLVQLLRDPALRERLGSSARATIAAQHNYREIAEATAGVYTCALQEIENRK